MHAFFAFVFDWLRIDSTGRGEVVLCPEKYMANSDIHAK
jgi:hypothetical protein